MATSKTGLASFYAGLPAARRQAVEAGFGKAPPISEVEKEAAALRAYLGQTDYASRLQESQKLTKLQMALALAQRGFASMGAAPQRGESPIGTIGRTLLSPLAADIAPIAGRLMQQRVAAKAAREKEDRDIKLAAYTQATTRGKELDATTLGILKAYASIPAGITSSVIQNVNAEIKIGGEIKKLSSVPIILRKDNKGKSTIHLAGEHQTNDGIKVSAGTELSSFKKVATKDQLPKTYVNIGETDLTIPLKARDGRPQSINLPSGKRASLHPNEFSQLPEAVRRNLTVYTVPPEAGGSLTTWVNVSGTAQSINLPGFSAMLEDGDEVTLTAFQYSQLPEVMKIGDVLSRKEKPTIERGLTGQVFKNGKFVNLNNATRATRLINNVPVDTYYHQIAEGNWEKIPQDTFTETIATHGDFKKEASIHIAYLTDAAGAETGVVADALNDASAIAGGVVDVWRSRIKSPNKGDDRVRYYFKGTDVTDKITRLIGTDAFQSKPLSQVDLQKAGQTVVERKIYTNYSTIPHVLNVGGEKVTLDPGGFYPLSESERNAQSGAVKSALRVVAPVSAEPVTYTFKKKTLVGDKEYLPGHTITVTPSVYREFEERIQQALTTDPAEKAVILKKKHITSLVDLIRAQEPRLVNATFGTREMEAVLAQFPGAARGASAAEKLYDIVVSIMKYSNTSQGQASNAAISADKDKETTYSESVEQELNWAKKAYKGYQVKGALPPTPFDQLPFMDRMAFARLSQSGLNLRNVDAKWQAAKTALGVTRAKYKAPTSGDVAMFANKVRLRTILRDMLENYDLGHTGLLMGPLEKIRGAFSGWPLIGSIEAGKFASTLSQLSANMRSLQAGEGKDARPSNYRIGLITDLLPKWGRAEDINTRNVKQAIAVLDTNIKSYFADAVASEAIVPQSFSRMAAEAGLKDLGVHQGKYWWLDPKVSEAEQLPFTMEDYRRSIGEVPWSQSSFNEMKPGVMLPRSALSASKTGGVQTYWVKAKDRKGQGMIIETDRFSRPLKGAKAVPFVMRQKKEK
jgi:hypothetical protein